MAHCGSCTTYPPPPATVQLLPTPGRSSSVPPNAACPPSRGGGVGHPSLGFPAVQRAAFFARHSSRLGEGSRPESSRAPSCCPTGACQPVAPQEAPPRGCSHLLVLDLGRGLCSWVAKRGTGLHVTSIGNHSGGLGGREEGVTGGAWDLGPGEDQAEEGYEDMRRDVVRTNLF